MVPCGGLATLPLQGLAYEDGGRCQLDDLDVVFAPSVQILRELSRRQSSVPQASARFVGVADPTHDLRFASLEVHGIARRFEAPMILPTEADRETVLSAIEEADLVHLACHARYQPEELLDSYFLLGAGEQLTLRDPSQVGPNSDCRSSSPPHARAR
jgi:CHAT domain-containing protein